MQVHFLSIYANIHLVIFCILFSDFSFVMDFWYALLKKCDLLEQSKLWLRFKFKVAFTLSH